MTRVACRAGGAALAAPAVTLILTLALSACDHSATQLSDFKDEPTANKFGTTAEAEVTCTPSDPACGQLHLLKGHACYRQARQATADAEKRRFYSCAIDQLGTGLQMSPSETGPLGSMQVYRIERMTSLRDRSDLGGPTEAADRTQLATDAADFRRRYPGQPAGPYFAAAVQISQLQVDLNRDQTGTEYCRQIGEAKELIDEGQRNPGDFRANLAAAQKQIVTLRTQGGCK